MVSGNESLIIDELRALNSRFARAEIVAPEAESSVVDAARGRANTESEIR